MRQAYKEYNLYFFNSEVGQTLVEAIVAIAIAVVIVTSMVTLGIGTQRAANTSRTLTQSTKYGQDAMEIIRSIRDQSLQGSITGMSAVFPACAVLTCKFTDLYQFTLNPSAAAPVSPSDAASGVYFNLVSPNPPDNATCVGGVSCWQLTKTTGTPQLITGTVYSRTIRVWDSNDNTSGATDPWTRVKYIEIIISWTDGSGTHTSKTFTKLSNFNADSLPPSGGCRVSPC